MELPHISFRIVSCYFLIVTKKLLTKTKTPASKEAVLHQGAIRCVVLNFYLFQFLRQQWERKCGTISIGGDSPASLIAFRGY